MWDLIVSVPDHCLSFSLANNFSHIRTYTSTHQNLYESVRAARGKTALQRGQTVG